MMIPALAPLLALLLSSAASTGMAQSPKPAPAKMPQHQHSMKGDPAMTAMMSGPHHRLAMAYRDNLATFARALQLQTSQSKTLDLELARPAVTEMRRSFDQMQQHRQAQMAMMNDSMKPMMNDSMKSMMSGDMKPPMSATKKPMMEMMQQMETHVAALNEHLTALEIEVNASVPAPASVSAHTAEIVKHCAAMSGMAAKPKAKAKPVTAKPHTMK